MELKEKTCCFTGHRRIPPGQQHQLARQLEETVRALVRQGVVYFGAGGALGFDSLAAQCVLKLREELPQIKLILVLPCLSQAEHWPASDRERYEAIKKQADKVVYTSKEYTRDCMFRRNRYLVDHSSVCVCYLTERGGGTAYTVQYAKLQELKIINLAALPKGDGQDENNQETGKITGMQGGLCGETR